MIGLSQEQFSFQSEVWMPTNGDKRRLLHDSTTRSRCRSHAQALRAEIIAIERAFPELRLPQRRRAVRRSLKAATTRTRKMSAAARKAVSARMKRAGRASEGAGKREVAPQLFAIATSLNNDRRRGCGVDRAIPPTAGRVGTLTAC
jgi:hypothetical protein